MWQKPLREWNHKDTKTQSFFRAGSSSARQAKKSSFVPSCLCGSKLLCFLRQSRNEGGTTLITWLRRVPLMSELSGINKAVRPSQIMLAFGKVLARGCNHLRCPINIHAFAVQGTFLLSCCQSVISANNTNRNV